MSDVSRASLLRCRAVCPANEGIETRRRLLFRRSPDCIRRAVCPANEGIETSVRQFADQPDLRVVARSAPLMRGLKLFVGTTTVSSNSTVARSAPLMRGLKPWLLF